MGARFVRLGIAGFKSFADATSIEILPGLTGIVGPNGCGKSNVAEALRWAMGEANARHLRGGEMDDIIFAGTAHRASRNLAEVSLTVEDDEAGLPPPFTGQAELQIVRRIERGTGSAYRVNGREARARDVQTLFADLASGARSSAMVSQGRVGQLVNARPEERRAVLEEAAGITGLHARRAEAETRLRATETNLERAEERRVLLERQLDGLRGQAKQAARYRTVTTAALEAEAMLLAVQRSRAAIARDQAVQALAAAREAVHHAMVAASAADHEAERTRTALPSLRATASAAATGLERQRLLQDSLAADAARARAALNEATQRQTQLARDLAHAEAVVQDAEGADARLVAEAERLQAETEAHPPQLQAAQEAAESAASALRQADEAFTETSAKAATAVAQAEAAQHLLQQAEARAQRADDARARATAEMDRAWAQMIDPARVAGATEALAAAEHAVSASGAALAAAEAERTQATAAAVAARQEHGRLDAQRQRLAAEASALAEVLAVKDGERWPPMIDRLAVPPGFEAALGAALGEELAAAADPSSPRHWRQLPACAPGALPGQRLSDMVRGPEAMGRALDHIALVDSESEGDASHAMLQPGQSLVSKAGAVWRWDGYTIRAGTPTAAAVRLQQRNRLSLLRNQLSEATEAATDARRTWEAADARERAAAKRDHDTRTARRDADAALDRARTNERALRTQADSAANRLSATEEQLTRTAPEADAARDALEIARAERAKLPDPAGLRARSEACRTAVNLARQKDGAAARTLEALQRAAVQRQARLASIERERDDRRMRAMDLIGRVTDLRARHIEAAADHERLAATPAKTARDAEAAKAALLVAEGAAKDASQAVDAAERAAAEAASTARGAEHAVYAARETLVRAETAQEAAEQAWTATLERVAEREAALPSLPVHAETTAAAEDRARSRLNRLIQERDGIGPVNLRAEIEAGIIEADMATIARERDEFGTAIAKLRGSIGHLNREGRERLSAVFQQVDRHFQALFGRMFGGGRAHLALIGSDDPLEAGLEIYAQPPGKKLSSLSLLSGGEQALTALSLIFAVFRCNPAPLCVLDEVDAPLDDANVGRFVALLTDMVQETGTRFLVVTHHQVTMAGMDRLYGVTMQERGISRLLSVDLSHAVGMIEAIAAE